MSTTTIAIIFIGFFFLLLIFWLVRSRGNTSGHIDTTLTAVGAATEAVEDIIETVTHKSEPLAEKPADPVIVQTASAPVLSGGNDTAMLDIGVAAAEGAPDNLQQLKGVGPKLVARLTELGITRFDQIAAWKPADIEKVDAHLGAFKGRITRDHWIDQAGFLARGDIAGFEAKFGKLDG